MATDFFSSPLELTERGAEWLRKTHYLCKILDADGNLVEIRGSMYDSIHDIVSKASVGIPLTRQEADLLFRYKLVQYAQGDAHV